MSTQTNELLVKMRIEAEEALRDLKKVEQQTNKTSKEFSKIGKNNKRFNAQLQNSSYQIADFAVQVGGGTSALRAFSQQAPQLLAGFGAIGAAVGAVTAILAAGANSLFNFGDAAEKSAKQTEKMAEVVKGLISPSTGLSSLNKQLAESESRFAGLAKALRDIERAKAVEALKGLEKELGSFITGLTRYSDTASTGLLNLSESLKRLEGDAAAIEGISENLNVDSDAAEEILKIVNAFKKGSLDAAEFAKQLTGLGVEPDTEGFVELLALLEQIAKQAAIVKDLSSIDIELNVKGDDLQGAIDSWDDYVSSLEAYAETVKRGLDPTIEMTEQIKKLNLVYDAGYLSLEQYNAQLEKIANLKPRTSALQDALDNFDKQILGVGNKGEEIKTLLQELQTEAGKWSDQFADTLVSGLAEGKLAFEDFASYVIQQLARIAVSKALEPLFNAFGNLIGGAIPSAVPTGLIAVPVNDLPISREMGGTQQMLVGTPRMSAPTNNSSPVTVNVYNQGSDNVEVNERKTTRGVEIDVLIKSTVKRGIASGDFDKVMATSYGARRMAY